jgi:hypothetical protein
MRFSIHQNKCSTPGSKQKYMVLSPFKINALISMLKSLSQTLLQKRELSVQTIEKKKGNFAAGHCVILIFACGHHSF